RIFPGRLQSLRLAVGVLLRAVLRASATLSAQAARRGTAGARSSVPDDLCVGSHDALAVAALAGDFRYRRLAGLQAELRRRLSRQLPGVLLPRVLPGRPRPAASLFVPAWCHSKWQQRRTRYRLSMNPPALPGNTPPPRCSTGRPAAIGLTGLPAEASDARGRKPRECRAAAYRRP